MIAAWVLDIYVPQGARLAAEPWPVVQHLFYGQDQAAALAVYRDHLREDPMVRAAVLEGRLSDRPCHAATVLREDIEMSSPPSPIRPAAIGIALAVDSYAGTDQAMMSHVFYGPHNGAVQAWEAFSAHERALGVGSDHVRRVRWYEDGRWTDGPC